jgi:hypothetical protein
MSKEQPAHNDRQATHSYPHAMPMLTDYQWFTSINLCHSRLSGTITVAQHVSNGTMKNFHANLIPYYYG